uniref:Uncharacterized protein n=1 Tax=Rhizophora mucronata TaxID=61149 RepID=A0A2P2R5I0_RHIMU
MMQWQQLYCRWQPQQN